MSNKNIWNFKAENVHDFVWAADPDYVHDILRVDSENLELHFYYQKTNDEMVSNWKRLQDDTADAFKYLNEKMFVQNITIHQREINNSYKKAVADTFLLKAVDSIVKILLFCNLKIKIIR